MAEGKWISGLHEDLEATAAARLVLEPRLKATTEWLPRAISHAQDDSEHVHQLRVSTRRAGAALRTFAPLLPAKARRAAARLLRQVRRAAGEARDWDVFREALAQRLSGAAPEEQAGLDLLIGLAHGERMRAQDHLRQASRKPLNQLDDQIQLTLEQVRLPEKMPANAALRDLAIPQLSTLLAELTRALSGDRSDWEYLHRIRIIGKRLRYAMELFESCFPAAFRERFYPAVEELQEILGPANDSHVALGRLDVIQTWVRKSAPEHWERYRPGLEGLLRFHQERLPRQRHLFEQWLSTWRQIGAEFALALILKAQGPLPGTVP